jgi:hypothetical protein
LAACRDFFSAKEHVECDRIEGFRSPAIGNALCEVIDLVLCRWLLVASLQTAEVAIVFLREKK